MKLFKKIKRWFRNLFAPDEPVRTLEESQKATEEAGKALAEAIAEQTTKPVAEIRAKVDEMIADERKKTLKTQKYKRTLPPIMPVRFPIAAPDFIDIDFARHQYMPDHSEKVGFCLHHSAGRDNARGMFGWWESNPQRVATAYGIEDNGAIYRGFDGLKAWAYAINVRSRANRIPLEYKHPKHGRELERAYINLEICSWGWLTEKNGKYYSWTGDEVHPDRVVRYDHAFRGFHFFEAYTDEEIAAVEHLLRWHHQEHGISLECDPLTMFDIDERALNIGAGVFTHASFRTDKSDCHPQAELIQMLNSLNE